MSDQRAPVVERVQLTNDERRMLLLAYRDTVLAPGEAVVIQAQQLLAARLRVEAPAVEVQRWERRQVGVDMGMHLEVDGQGRVTVHEAVLAQLLVDAGWERTA